MLVISYLQFLKFKWRAISIPLCLWTILVSFVIFIITSKWYLSLLGKLVDHGLLALLSLFTCLYHIYLVVSYINTSIRVEGKYRKSRREMYMNVRTKQIQKEWDEAEDEDNIQSDYEDDKGGDYNGSNKTQSQSKSPPERQTKQHTDRDRGRKHSDTTVYDIMNEPLSR